MLPICIVKPDGQIILRPEGHKIGDEAYPRYTATLGGMWVGTDHLTEAQKSSINRFCVKYDVATPPEFWF